MSRRSLIPLCALMPALAFADASLPDVDMKASHDPAGLARYEGSLIVDYHAGAYEDIALPMSPIERVEPEQHDGMNNVVFAAKNALPLEGKLTRVVYLLPTGRTPLEVVRNYQQMLAEKGGERLYECKGDTCGGDAAAGAGHGGGEVGIGDILFPKDRINAEAFSNAACSVTMSRADQRYALGRMKVNGIDMHVAVLAFTATDDLYCRAFNERTVAIVLTLESKAREQKMVMLKAADMASTIASSGHVALYGIHFDFDKADVRPESKAQLDEIATLLKNDATLKLQIVGHTDNHGGADYNADLSRRRADAVASALSAQFGIAAERLSAQGMGSSAPVASNDNEDGRAKNRRVELVRQ